MGTLVVLVRVCGRWDLLTRQQSHVVNTSLVWCMVINRCAKRRRWSYAETTHVENSLINFSRTKTKL
jgi:hypothetical protein